MQRLPSFKLISNNGRGREPRPRDEVASRLEAAWEALTSPRIQTWRLLLHEWFIPGVLVSAAHRSSLVLVLIRLAWRAGSALDGARRRRVSRRGLEADKGERHGGRRCEGVEMSLVCHCQSRRVCSVVCPPSPVPDASKLAPHPCLVERQNEATCPARPPVVQRSSSAAQGRTMEAVPPRAGFCVRSDVPLSNGTRRDMGARWSRASIASFAVADAAWWEVECRAARAHPGHPRRRRLIPTPPLADCSRASVSISRTPGGRLPGGGPLN